MKFLFSIFLSLISLVSFGQHFEIVGAKFEGENSPVKGEVYVDIDNKSLSMEINGKEMTIPKMSFRRGDVGELFCFKETIELKQRFKFSPNKERKGDLVNISHLMTYTVVQSFSNKRSEFIYYLIKKRRQLRRQ